MKYEVKVLSADCKENEKDYEDLGTFNNQADAISCLLQAYDFYSSCGNYDVEWLEENKEFLAKDFEADMDDKIGRIIEL